MRKKHLIALSMAIALSANIFATTFVGAATLYGDLNSDGNINSTDYSLMKRELLGMVQVGDLTSRDLNADGAFNSTDYTILKRYLLGIIDIFPVETLNPSLPTPTPPQNGDSEPWELNKGTINLGGQITFTGTGISVNGSTVNITAGGDHTVSGTLSNGMIVVETTEKVKLRLSNASITNSNGPAIYCKNAKKLFITLDSGSTNTLTDGRYYSDQTLKGTISSNDDLEIKGSGTLNITGNYKHAISSNDDINLENGTINITSAVSDGVHANGSIEVKGGTYNITVSKDCMQTEDEELTVEDGYLNLSAGSQALASDTGVVINGGTVNITKAEEGIEAPNITINGGSLSVNANDDGLNATMGTGSFQSDGSVLKITGGSIYLNSTVGDPLDSNGSLTVSGGTTVVHGPQGAPEVAVDVNGTYTVTGGVLFSCGPSAMMAQYPTGASQQYTIAAMFSSQPANSAFCVKDSSGKVLFMTRPKRNYIYAVYSSPELRQGSTYTFYAGGTISGGTEVNGVISGGTYNGGTAVSTITVNTSPTTTSNWSGGWGGFPGGGWGGGFPGGW